MRAFQKKRGLDSWDWYFGERTESSSVCEKDTKRKGECSLGKTLVLLNFELILIEGRKMK